MIKRTSAWAAFSSVLLCAASANQPLSAQTPIPATTPVPAVPVAMVTYAGGRLSIEAADKTLAEILGQIAIATKVKIDLPPDVTDERLPLVKLGPGPPRDVLASLLRDAHLSFLIQGSDTDPQQIQSVLLMPSDPRGGANNDPEPGAPPVRSIYARTMAATNHADQTPADQAQPVESAASLVPTPPIPTAADDSASQAPPPSAPPLPVIPADQMMTSNSSQPAQLNGARIAPLSPPPVMSTQSINQQLQQMYQQRIQIGQQDKAAAPEGAVVNHD